MEARNACVHMEGPNTAMRGSRAVDRGRLDLGGRREELQELLGDEARPHQAQKLNLDGDERSPKHTVVLVNAAIVGPDILNGASQAFGKFEMVGSLCYVGSARLGSAESMRELSKTQASAS
eukprot:scaffold591450_cov14-Prasinocladus_malaysianus.AAC.1